MFAKAHLTAPTARGICRGWRERGDFAVMLERKKLAPARSFKRGRAAESLEFLLNLA